MEVRRIDELKRFDGERYVQLFRTGNTSTWLCCYGPGVSSERARHPNADQVLYVVEGRGLFKVGKEEAILREGEVVLVPQNVPHQIVNSSSSNLAVLLVEAPVPVETVYLD